MVASIWLGGLLPSKLRLMVLVLFVLPNVQGMRWLPRTSCSSRSFFLISKAGVSVSSWIAGQSQSFSLGMRTIAGGQVGAGSHGEQVLIVLMVITLMIAIGFLGWYVASKSQEEFEYPSHGGRYGVSAHHQSEQWNFVQQPGAAAVIRWDARAQMQYGNAPSDGRWSAQGADWYNGADQQMPYGQRVSQANWGAQHHNPASRPSAWPAPQNPGPARPPLLVPQMPQQQQPVQPAGVAHRPSNFTPQVAPMVAAPALEWPPSQILSCEDPRLGLTLVRYPRVQHPDDSMRWQVRDGTKMKVAKELGLPQFGYPSCQALKLPPFCNDTTLFRDVGNGAQLGVARDGGAYLLARFDVVALRATADFDASWHFLQGGPHRPFWVLHAVAINIGESQTATDFQEYSSAPGRLDEARYVSDMGRIFENIVEAAVQLNVSDIVWFPFGMGAFLRNLGLLDVRYKQTSAGQISQPDHELRRAVGGRFRGAASIATANGRHIHLCLGPDKRGGEADANVDAFVRAVVSKSGPPLASSAISIHLHGDALELSQRLANDGRNVALVNGANRRLIGNHWFDGGARRAIDENLHRRSWRMSAHAYVLNGFDAAQATPLRNQGELETRVQQLGGKVRYLRSPLQRGRC